MPFNDFISDALIRHDIDLLRFDAKLRRQILGHLRNMQDDIIAQLANVDFSNVAKRQRLTSMLQQVSDLARRGYTTINKHMLTQMEDLAALEHSFQTAKLNDLFKADILTGALTPSTLSAMAKSSNIFGAPAQEWWGRQSANLRKRFSDQMRQGFLLGEGTGDLVRRVRGSATGARRIIEVGGVTKSVAAFSGGIMDVTTREAEALVRTSVQSIANEVRLETYIKNTDVIGSIYAQVTLDSRTSDICISHGAGPDEWTLPDFEPIGGSNNFTGPPPWHFNCRSSLVPITKSWEELQRQGSVGGATRRQRSLARKLDNNVPARTRASMNGQVPRRMSYGDWLRGQPKSVQLEVLGPGRRKLWQQGKLNLTQTIDQTGRPLTLHQLGQLPANKALPLKLPPRTAPPILPKATTRFKPPAAKRITASGLLTLGVNKTYIWNREIFKTIKVDDIMLKSVKWDPKIGKFGAASEAIIIQKGVPPIIKPPKGIRQRSLTAMQNLKIGDTYKLNGEAFKVVGKVKGGVWSVHWNGAAGRWEPISKKVKLMFV